ncbi:hypothetical protein JCM8097_005097 [Rhodosporidiobolus ruineniae]
MLRSTHLLRLSLRPQRARLASTLPRVAPVDGQPFSAPDKGDPSRKQGALGQVYMPDTAEIEKEVEHRISIPTAPDSYRSTPAPTASEAAAAADPSASVPKISTATPRDPSTLSSGSSGDDVQTGQAGDSTASLPKEADRSRDGNEGEGSRPLTEDEKSGLWKLLGIVAGGYTLGLITDPKWRRGEKA